MKILHVITRLILGGAQQNTVMCCRAQVSGGHQVWLAYGPIYGPEGSLLKEAQASGAKLVQINAMRRAVLPFHDLRCYAALRRLIRELQPDIVHTHSSKAGILGRAAAWRQRVPAVIHTIHGLPFHTCQNRLLYKGYVAAERWAARRCHRLIGLTQAMCDAFAEHGIGRPEQFCVVPSGVDSTLFRPSLEARQRVRADLKIPETAPVIGMVARFDRLKGHNDLLDVLPSLVDRSPDLRMLFVGDGYCRAALEGRVRTSGLIDQVIFTGLQPPSRVAELLAAMDVMALPSYQEGQGRALVEALLCGCAVVGYAVGGISEICIDGQTGRLVSPGDPGALAQAITWSFDHPEQCRRLVRQGQSHVLERFGAQTMCHRLERIYSQTQKWPAAC